MFLRKRSFIQKVFLGATILGIGYFSHYYNTRLPPISTLKSTQQHAPLSLGNQQIRNALKEEEQKRNEQLSEKDSSVIEQREDKEKEIEEKKVEQEKGSEKVEEGKKEDEKIENGYVKRFPTYEFGRQSEEYMIIVADLPYTQKFQQILKQKIGYILNKRKSSQNLKIYKLNLKENKSKLEEKLKAPLEEEALLILKNPYDDRFITVTFDMLLDYQKILPVFLSDVNSLQQKNNINIIQNMKPTQTYLIYVMGTQQPEQRSKGLLIAKSIQIGLATNNLDNIKVIATDTETLRQNGIIDEAKVNSLHLIRKSNMYTLGGGNKTLFNMPFHIMENINFADKKGQILVKKYLNKIEVFDSIESETPFLFVIQIDKTLVDASEEQQIVDAFATLKQNNKYPFVSFIVSFGKTKYTGEANEPFLTKKWQAKMINLQELNKQTDLHLITNLAQLQKLNRKRSQWGKYSHEYLYQQPEISPHLLSNFIDQVIEGKVDNFYETEKKPKFQNVNKLTGENFNEKVIRDIDSSHIVFEYSDHCLMCNMLSPLIDGFGKVSKTFPELQLKVHALNCDRNQVKGHVYSPYTPNIYYFSKKLKNKRPLRYPITEYFNSTGLMGLYDFCEITQTLSLIDIDKFESAVADITKANVRISDF